MKKTIAIILALIMTASVAVAALADSVNPTGYTPEGTTAVVKHVDKANLKKDGVIGEDEYERLDIDVGEDTTILHAAFASAIALEDALNMLQYMEYYASWSDGQINIAVKSRPTEIKQVIPVETGEYPEDNFCKNTAFTVSSDTQQEREQGTVCNFYFAFALRTDTNEYQVGYYGADQRGNSESYLPVAGQDFAISYPGDGTAIFEISIPFSEICEGGAAEAGDSVYLSIGAEGGSGDTKDSDTSYSISLGDFTYYVSQKSAVNHAAFLLSDEELKTAVENPFKDVADIDYFFDPVMWAVKNKVTSGTDADTFSPNDTCTRAQVVTFLWRAKGSPEPNSSENPFVDVKADDYFYKAVLWAKENNITSGTDATHFSPDDGCTRAQVVTFLWRTEGEPDAGSAENPFADVGSEYYTSAVLWAVAQDITKGTDTTHFSPNDTCTRGQIVTFLYRDLAK